MQVIDLDERQLRTCQPLGSSPRFRVPDASAFRLMAMNRHWPLALKLACILIGLAASRRLAAEADSRTLVHDGKSRSYILHLPKASSKDQPMPLVLVLHGAGATGAMTQALTGFDRLADKHTFAVAYPDGINKVWNYASVRRLQALKKGGGTDDVGFLKALIDELVRDGTVDKHRVYATGISNGAYMSNRLALDASDRIAAVAPVAGTMGKFGAERTKADRPMPVLYIHGTDDKLVSFEGVDFITKRALSLSANDFVDWWAKQNGCDKNAGIELLPDVADDGVTVKRHTFEDKRGRAPVVFYEVVGGGHTWPGGKLQPESLLGKTCRDFNASEVIWEFFRQHSSPE